MISPRPKAFWRAFAQGCAGGFIGFAMVASSRHSLGAGLRRSSRGLRSLRCYPSPSLRSGPSQAGPILVRGSENADRVSRARNCFQIRDIAVESAAITTNLRGRSKCRSRLSSSPFFPLLWPVACRTPRPAAWQVRPLARWSLTRWMKTCLQVPPSAALRALQPAVSSSACRAATRATEPLTDLSAFGRIETRTRTIRADRPGGPFLLRLMGEADV
ncbi:MAG: hypothetical protein FD150_589 [Rhodobacteraceae bacterium]|nr:MAG: hypothetical protein FD150_589 [Paracoccaceae bacterium]